MSLVTTRTAEDVDITDTRQLRGAFGAFATGVTVVTVGGRAWRGMTANSFTALSLDPPLVLVCVGKEAVMHGSLTGAEDFSVSVLAAGQEDIARHFADPTRPAGLSQFATVGWEPGRATDAPLIAGADAHFECVRQEVHDGGDHTIFIGRVVAARKQAPAADTMVFRGGRFRGLAEEREAA